jgi:nucleoside-diphosphate-sugar epimerase
MKRRVLLTGATGTVGCATLRELLRRRDELDLVLLAHRARPAEADGVTVVRGDIRSYADVAEAMRGVDVVLHLAAVIPPAAEGAPRLTEEVNVGGTENVVRAIRAQPGGAERIRLIHASSLAVYGDRLPPIHVARVGDPVRPAAYDFYGVTKARAERAVIDGGVRSWAVLRLTYIARPDVASMLGPFMYHMALRAHIELLTAADAGVGLARAVERGDGFFGRVYDMSGGPACRVVYEDYLGEMLRRFGLGDHRRLVEPDWFIRRNSHCCWFADGDALQAELGHQRETLEDHYRQALERAAWYLKLGGRLAPAPLVKQLVMRRLALGKDGPLRWTRDGDRRRVDAFFGPRARAAAPDGPARLLEHGPAGDDLAAVRAAAAFRGGTLRSDAIPDPATPLSWRCPLGHDFEASLRLVRAGHFCPTCVGAPWRYDEIAARSPFIAQAHYANHDPSEQNVYDVA